MNDIFGLIQSSLTRRIESIANSNPALKDRAKFNRRYAARGILIVKFFLQKEC